MSKKKEVEAALAKFQPGAAVRLTENVLHVGYRNLCGRVVRTIKSRGMVTVECENGSRYDAFPQNVELLADPMAQNT